MADLTKRMLHRGIPVLVLVAVIVGCIQPGLRTAGLLQPGSGESLVWTRRQMRKMALSKLQSEHLELSERLKEVRERLENRRLEHKVTALQTDIEALRQQRASRRQQHQQMLRGPSAKSSTLAAKEPWSKSLAQTFTDDDNPLYNAKPADKVMDPEQRPFLRGPGPHAGDLTHPSTVRPPADMQHELAAYQRIRRSLTVRSFSGRLRVGQYVWQPGRQQRKHGLVRRDIRIRPRPHQVHEEIECKRLSAYLHPTADLRFRAGPLIATKHAVCDVMKIFSCLHSLQVLHWRRMPAIASQRYAGSTAHDANRNWHHCGAGAVYSLAVLVTRLIGSSAPGRAGRVVSEALATYICFAGLGILVKSKSASHCHVHVAHTCLGRSRRLMRYGTKQDHGRCTPEQCEGKTEAWSSNEDDCLRATVILSFTCLLRIKQASPSNTQREGIQGTFFSLGQ